MRVSVEFSARLRQSQATGETVPLHRFLPQTGFGVEAAYVLENRPNAPVLLTPVTHTRVAISTGVRLGRVLGFGV